jgi:hypothetical protein
MGNNNNGKQLYKYIIAYTFEDGTIEEFEIETERNLDISKDINYLDQVILQFKQHT